MGADQFTYTVDYEGDPSASLQKLRQSVFDSGEFNCSDNGYASIEEIFMDFELMEAGGTGTIIDITSIGETPDIGTAIPMSEEEQKDVFGTTRPREEDLEKGAEYFMRLARGHCRYILLYDDEGEPTKIHFCGFSWD